MKDYTEFADLANVYLEDSFVLGIDETPSALSFKLEVALTSSHPRYHEPKPAEQHCYANATLTIGAATRIEWVTRSSQTSRDATGEEDLGNIDSLKQLDDHYEITGDWGHARVYATAAPKLIFAIGSGRSSIDQPG